MLLYLGTVSRNRVIYLFILAILALGQPVFGQSGGSTAPTLARVIIDPGHGGEDAGVMGPSGWSESELALTMALQLKAALEKELDLQVYLTRDEDQSLSLTERTELANAFKADLLISLHAAGAFSTGRSGFRVYYQNYRSQPGLGGEQTSESQAGLVQEWDSAQALHVADSYRLAVEIDRALSEVLRTTSRGPLGLPLTLLAGATQPAVLIEVGTLTNAEEERRLKTTGYRDAVTTALLRGIRIWRHWYERRN